MFIQYVSLGLLLVFPAGLLAQTAIPPGTVLPLSLETTLQSGKTHPEKLIRARVMQNIPGTSVHRGAKVLGHVISISPDHIALRFDTLVDHGRSTPITTNLRTLASMMDIDLAQIPGGGADRALTPEQRSVTLIGGEEDYRPDGPVTRGMAVVGQPTPYGVLAMLQTNPPCRANLSGNDQPQALWLFSSDACGLYGFSDLRVEHYGRTNPAGVIILASRPGKLHIRSGSGLLLRVQSP
ncbi:MAG TPA: hypothetical protein VME86_05420 [Acidobacteriaceae bacterium]|nr:hypothetical protein [Acidobacteriaceae bacterium]